MTSVLTRVTVADVVSAWCIVCTACCLQAISIVSDLVSRGRFDELEGLVTNEVRYFIGFDI